jgi:hypothetical protein
MASSKNNFESMTVAQLQAYLQGEGVELPKQKQLKQYYVNLANQQNEISSGNLTSPRTRWGRDPVELRTSPIGDAAGNVKAAKAPGLFGLFDHGQGPQNSSQQRQEEAGPSTRSDRTLVDVPKQPAKSETGSTSKRLHSPDRGRPVKQEGQETPLTARKSPRRMREMSPLRRAKSPMKRRVSETKPPAPSAPPRNLDETLFGTLKSAPQPSKRSPEAGPSAQTPAGVAQDTKGERAEVKREAVVKKKSSTWMPSFLQRSKRGPETKTRTRKIAPYVWGTAKAGGRLLGRLLSCRPPPWLLFLFALGVAFVLAASYLRAALKPVPFCDTGVLPAGTLMSVARVPRSP